MDSIRSGDEPEPEFMPYEADRSFRPRSLVLAILAGALACALFLGAVGLLRAGPSIGSLGLLAFVMYFVGGVVAAVLLGLPALFVLRAAGMANAWSVLLTGAVVGAAIGWNSGEGGARVSDVWPWLVAGLLAGQASWSAWRWSEPGPSAISPTADFTTDLEEALSELESHGFHAQVAEARQRCFAACTTSSEWLGEAGEAIDALLRSCGSSVPQTSRIRLEGCLREVRKVWPKYRAR